MTHTRPSPALPGSRTAAPPVRRAAGGRPLLCLLAALLILSGCRAARAAAWPGERRGAPGEGNPHYYAGNPYYKKGYGLPNCTAYAWGRVSELLGQAPRLNATGDARYWFGYTLDGYRRGRKPRLGAVACWQFGCTGHVAVVERIEGDCVTISQSHWSARKPGSRSAPFSRCTMKADGSDYLSGFQGYIYACDFDAPDEAAGGAAVAQGRPAAAAPGD